MAAAEYGFEIEKGTSFYLSFDYKDDNQVPINLTGWCARLRWLDSAGNIQTFTTNTINSSHYFVIDPLIGRITLQFPATYTSALTFTSAAYDLELQEPNDLYSGGGKKVFRILKGTISLLTRNVTPNDVFVCNTDSQDPCNNCQ